MAGVGDGQFDEVGRQAFEFLAIGNGGGECRRVFGGNALSDIGPFAPDLVLEVRTGFGAGRVLPIFGFETTQLHGLEGRHLFENEGSLREIF